jgi:hypothetical protein
MSISITAVIKIVLGESSSGEDRTMETTFKTLLKLIHMRET